MPIYEYVCEDCGHAFMRLTSFANADRLPECPLCQGKHTQKKISLVASHGEKNSAASGSSSSCNSTGRFT